MKSVLTPELLELFPDFVRGVVVGRNIDNSKEDSRLAELLREAEAAAVRNEALADIKNHPRIASWRQAYLDFGTNPNKYVSSIESLCKRVQKGAQLPYINTAVALFNYVSLKHIVPSGGDDIDSARGDLRLTRARGTEPFTAFNTDTVEYPLEGEVIYLDDVGVMCRRWNWRQGDHTKLLPETKNIAVNVDCLAPVTPAEAEAITAEMAGLLKEFCGGETRWFLLNRARPEAEI